ncbi:MAG: hypothetical protein QXJ17_05395 [Nitrososphaeria archaeon]
MTIFLSGKRKFYKFDDIAFLEELSKRLVEGCSFERALFDTIRTLPDRSLRKRIIYLMMGEKADKVMNHLPFTSGLPLFLVDLVKVRSTYAGKITKELTTILLTNRRYAKERNNLLNVLYYRCLLVSCLLGLTMAFLSQLSPILSIFYNFDLSLHISHADSIGVLPASFILGLFATLILNLIFRKAKTLLSLFLFSLFFYIGYHLSSPIALILNL